MKEKGIKKPDTNQQDHTRLLAADNPQAIGETAQAIKQGKLVVIPTDTVYGIGTNPFSERAVLNLYRVKRRPFDKGIPILLADLEDLEKVVDKIPEHAKILMTRFWPGPLTLIVPKHRDLPPAISVTDSVAVRIPANDIARAVIREAGGAIAASSANQSGEEPARLAATALESFQGEVAIVLDGGYTGGDLASTIIDCTGQEIKILRKGPITPLELNEINLKTE